MHGKKVSDEAASHPDKKNYRQILKEEVDAGANELRRSTAGLFLSGLSAGLDIGFSLLALGVVMSLISPDAGPLFRRAVLANAYSVGFIFVKLGSSELFTEHTTLAVFPVLRGRSTLKNLARLWGIVYVGNIAGAIVLAALVVLLSHQSELIHPQVFGVLARGAVDHPWWLLFLSAVLAGWMMGLLSWLTSATTETSGQIVCIWLVAAMIGLSGLTHTIVGCVEVLSGLFSDPSIGLGDLAFFLLWATLGNALGGVAFASIKYAHAVRGRDH